MYTYVFVEQSEAVVDTLLLKTFQTGKVLEVTVTASSSVLDAKNAILQLEGIPTDQQRLIFGGEHLDDARLLCDYNIKSSAIIYLVLKLTGC